MVEIDYKELEQETLDNVLTEILLREGTDYGEVETLFEDKKLQLLNLLELGQVVIVYHSSENFCDVISREQLNTSSY